MFTPDDDLEAKFTLEGERTGVVEEPRFRLLMMGDWSGDGAKRTPGQRNPIEIDRDNFDEVLGCASPAVQLRDGLTLNFKCLDDFHPDALFRTLPIFEELRDLRRRLKSDATYREAAREVRSWGAIETPATADETPAEARSGSLLDAILTQPKGGAPPPSPKVSSELSSLISDVVRPYIVNVDIDEQNSLIAAVDEATSGLMRFILRNPRFREVEAAWRALYLVVRRVETAPELKLYILDLNKQELIDDLADAGDLAESKMNSWLAAGETGDTWSAVCGNYAFEPTVPDVAALIRLSQICASAEIPFVSHMRPEIFGVSTLPKTGDDRRLTVSADTAEGKLWTTLRQIPESAFLGMTIPRFLARSPYGADSDPVEAFAFEEISGEPDEHSYLWANGCFIAALCMARNFAEGRLSTDVEGLPTHVYKLRGETMFQAAAEVQLSEKMCSNLAESGLMPIASFKNSDRVRLVQFRSISATQNGLKGSWTRA